MRKRSIIFNIAILAFSAALILGMLSPFIPLSLSSIPSYFGLSFPLIWTLSVGLALCCLFRKKKRKWFILIVLVGLAFIPRFFGLKNTVTKNEPRSIRLFTMNLRGGYSIVDKNPNIQDKRVGELNALLNSEIDILFLQEVSQRVLNWIEKDLSYTNQILSDQKGTFLATIYPIIDQGQIDFGSKVNSCVWADLSTPQGKVRVYNVHFESSKILAATEKAISEGREYNPNVFSSLGAVFNQYSRQAKKRVEQAEMVKRHIEQCDSPVILVGDFNETPMSYLYQIFNKDMNDLFEKSQNMGFTYPESSPLLRIDYIMASKNIFGEEFEVLRNISLSDHLPIKSSITVSKNN